MLFVDIYFQINVFRNNSVNIKEVFFMNNLDKPPIIAMLRLVSIVIIVIKFPTLSKDSSDIFSSSCVICFSKFHIFYQKVVKIGHRKEMVPGISRILVPLVLGRPRSRKRQPPGAREV